MIIPFPQYQMQNMMRACAFIPMKQMVEVPFYYRGVSLDLLAMYLGANLVVHEI